jgi:hypothetical protein
MKKISDTETEFTDEEMLVMEIHELLLDQGMSQGEAMIVLRGSRVPEELRTETPYLDAILTPEFVDYLCE